MRVAVLGRTSMLLDTADALVAAGHQIALIATCREAPEYSAGISDFEHAATHYGVPFLHTQSLNSREAVDALHNAGAHIAVSVNWVSRVGREAIAAFRFGILNAHAGDLPRYRGNAPVAWAILNGEQETVLTIHLMDPSEIDAGLILVQHRVALGDRYIGEVFAELESVAPSLFVRAVNGLTDGSLAPRPQTGVPLLGYSRRPEDGRIDWRNTAMHLHRLVRCSSEPFAGAYCTFNGQRLTIWRARVVQWPHQFLAVPGQVIGRDAAGVHVATGDGVLYVEEVGDHANAATVIRSLRDRLHNG